MTDNRTMEELLQAPMKGYEEAIVIPKINANYFEIKTNLLQLVQANPYHGFERENPHTYINNFKRITLTLKFWDVPNDSVPHHEFTELAQIDTFYNGLNDNDQDSLNATAGGNLLSKTTREALQIIDNKSKVHYSRNKSNGSRINMTSRENANKSDDRIEKPADQISTLVDIFAKKVVTRLRLKRLRNLVLHVEVVERETEETTDKEQTNFQGSTAYIQPLVTPIPEPDVSKTLPKPNIPYPSILNDQKLREKATNQMEKFFQIFQDLHFDISFADALLLMPKFASSIESFLTNKDKLFELAKIPLNENCSVMLLKNLPEKLRDPSKFLIPYRSITRPKGVAEDIFVKVEKFHFSTDFVVMDFEADPRVPLILWRSFLRTDHALIDVYGEEITLWVNDEAVTFNLNQTTRYSSTYDDLSVNRIDIIDVAREEYVQEILSFSNNSLRCNPISTSKPIISDSSHPLTPFEGNIYLIEKLLNDDPFQLHSMGLKQGEVVKAKSSIEERPDLELKDLPSHLEYAYLEGIVKLPVIIEKYLKVNEKEALLKVLKSHKRAIAWKITDIKGIDPWFCTYKILMEEDYKPAVQSQRQVKPKIHEVIKKEVIKLLDTGMIYPISDSPKLNDETRKDHFPLLFMDQMLERLVGNGFYCFLDEFSGYFQISINPPDQEKTTFTCPYGTFAYRRMPFGLCNALGTFQSDFAIGAVLGQLYAFEKFRPYLVLSKSIVYKDHSTLKYLLSKQDAKPRLIRWVLLLQEFDIIIPDKKGTENLAADHLSGLENPHKDVFENKDIKENFPLETLGKISSGSTPWFVDFEISMWGILLSKGCRPSKRRNSLRTLNITSGTDPTFFEYVRIKLFDAIISDRGTHFCNDNFAKVMYKYGVTHRFATAYHPQTSGQVEVSNRGLKRILKRTVGENHTSWFKKLDDALWETPIGCTSYKLVSGKSCHLPIELEHKAYWALKHANFDLKTVGDHRKLHLNELNQLRDQAYENYLIYKEKTKKLHDSKIKNCIFNVGDRVLLFNSRLKVFLRKLKTHWSGPFTITKVFPYGAVALSQPDGPNFKVNGHRLKHYLGRDVPQLITKDPHCLQPFLNGEHELFAPINILPGPKPCVEAWIHPIDLELLDSVIQCLINLLQRTITELVYLIEAHNHLNLISILKRDGLWRINDCIVMLVFEARGFPSRFSEVQLSLEKCHFMVKEGIVLGHKISKKELAVDRAKLDVIAKLPHPTTVKGVRSFLGHAGFYRRFIQDFSKIARPMTHLLEKETPFVFSKDCINAFETLKKNLTEALILVVPDWNLPFELMRNASDFAIGAVLGQ
nr:reverse transcriptase domain-containing protein [Tanacetum cinerariifolium]